MFGFNEELGRGGAASAPRKVASAYAITHHGELLQGAFEDADGGVLPALVTLCRPDLRAAAHFRATREAHVDVQPAWKTKARRAAELTLRRYGERGGRLRLDDHVPTGFGLGSSTSDVVASIRAVARSLGILMSASSIARIAVDAEEASDSIMFEGRTVLFAQRAGNVLEDLGPAIAPVEVLGFNTDSGGKGVDTLGLPLARYTPTEVQAFKPLLGLLRAAVGQQSAAFVGRVATASARINQRYLAKPQFDRLERIVEESGAVGLQVAHSGTVVGILFDAASPELEAQVLAAKTRVEEFGFDPYRFRSGGAM